MNERSGANLNMASTSTLHRVPVGDSDKHAIDSAGLLAIVAVMVGAWVVKELQHPNVQ